jgi:DNA-binding PadR family transcriptional regulator
MAATSSKLNVLGYALLGLLARGAQSGYDLAQGLKDPVSFFWHAQHSQIYPELAKLEVAGLIEHTRIEQTERPDKKVYNLTTDGEKALQTWLKTPTETPKKRDELVLKAYSIWLSNPHAAAQMMREHAEIHATHKQEFEMRLEKLEQKFGQEIWQPSSKWFSVHAVIQRGIGYEREYAQWCEWMANCLEQMPKRVAKTNKKNSNL